MTACCVLLCARGRAGNVTIAEHIALTGHGARIDAPVCDDRVAMIDAGLPWNHGPDATEPGRGQLVMSNDLDAAGISITDLLSIRENGENVHPDVSQGVSARVVQTLGDGSKEELALFLSRALMKRLHQPEAALGESSARRELAGPHE